MRFTDWFIDADTHVTEPGDVWTSRLPRKFQDAAPRMVRRDDGVDVWQFGRRERKIPVGAAAVAGWHEPFPSIARNLNECPPAAYDAKARLTYMDEIGAWAMARQGGSCPCGVTTAVTSRAKSLRACSSPVT